MADSSILDKSFNDLTKMKVMDLKNQLKQRGLPTTGNKNDLIERLQQSIQEDEDAVLNDDEDLEVLTPKTTTKLAEKPKSKPTPVAESTPAKPVPLNRKAAPVEEVVKPIAAKPVAEPEKKVEKKVEEVAKTKPVAKEPEAPKPAAEEDDEPKKKVVKLGELGLKERLEMRAKKFGLPPTEAAKKEARKERFNIESNGTSNGSSTVVSANGSVASVEQLKKRAERFGQSVSSLMETAEQLEKIEKRKARFGEVEPIRQLNSKVKIVK